MQTPNDIWVARQSTTTLVGQARLVKMLILAFCALCAAFLALGVKQAEATSLEEKMREHLAWIAAHSDYPADMELPAVVRLSHEQLQIQFYGELYFKYKNDGSMYLLDVVAVYDQETEIMYLDVEYDHNDPEQDHVLVHELTHHSQKKAGKFETYPCVQHSEREAYALHTEYLKERGVTDKKKLPDPFTVMLVSQCEHRT